jgi:hypothetical protein
MLLSVLLVYVLQRIGTAPYSFKRPPKKSARPYEYIMLASVGSHPVALLRLASESRMVSQSEYRDEIESYSSDICGYSLLSLLRLQHRYWRWTLRIRGQ